MGELDEIAPTLKLRFYDVAISTVFVGSSIFRRSRGEVMAATAPPLNEE